MQRGASNASTTACIGRNAASGGSGCSVDAMPHQHSPVPLWPAPVSTSTSNCFMRPCDSGLQRTAVMAAIDIPRCGKCSTGRRDFDPHQAPGRPSLLRREPHGLSPMQLCRARSPWCDRPDDWRTQSPPRTPAQRPAAASSSGADRVVRAGRRRNRSDVSACLRRLRRRSAGRHARLRVEFRTRRRGRVPAWTAEREQRQHGEHGDGAGGPHGRIVGMFGRIRIAATRRQPFLGGSSLSGVAKTPVEQTSAQAPGSCCGAGAVVSRRHSAIARDPVPPAQREFHRFCGHLRRPQVT